MSYICNMNTFRNNSESVPITMQTANIRIKVDITKHL